MEHIIEALKVVKEILCRHSGIYNLECSLVNDLEECFPDKCSTFCIYALLKLLYETILQKAYYILQDISEEDFYKIIRKRTKAYASFKATMITRLKGVNGVFKKKILKTYLKVSQYTHPSITIHKAYPRLDYELILTILDHIIYFEILINRERVASKANRLRDLICSLGLMKSCKKLSSINE
mgnify:CR=1 FL=1